MSRTHLATGSGLGLGVRLYGDRARGDGRGRVRVGSERARVGTYVSGPV